MGCRVDVHKSQLCVTKVKVSLHVKLRLKQTCTGYRHHKLSILSVTRLYFGVFCKPVFEESLHWRKRTGKCTVSSLTLCLSRHVFRSVEIPVSAGNVCFSVVINICA